MAEFFFSGKTKVTFTPYVPGETPTVAQLMGEQDVACDCGCMDVERAPAADLTFYREEPKPAGVARGYLVLQRGDQLAEVANVAMLYDGEGKWVGDIDPDSWRRCEIVEDQ